MHRCLTVVFLLTSAALAAGDLRVEAGPHEVRLQTGDRTYTLGDDAVIRPLGLSLHVVGVDAAGKGFWMQPKVLEAAQVVRDEAEVKAIRGTWSLSDTRPRYRIELELEVHAGCPALTVRCRVARAEPGSGDCYYYWSFGAPVTGYAAPGIPAGQFDRAAWDVRPHARWMYLAPKPGGTGYGVVTDGRVGRAPADGQGGAAGDFASEAYLNGVPRSRLLSEGESLDLTFTVLAARSADETAAVYRQVVAFGGDQLLFDAIGRDRRAFALAPRPSVAYHLRTGDGVDLGLTRDGRVASLAVGGARLDPPDVPALTGILLRDHRARSPLTRLGGQLREEPGAVVQAGQALGVEVNATWRALPDRIDLSAELHDTTRTDRAITVYVALPVQCAAGWSWGGSLEQARPVGGEEEYLTAAADSGAPLGANGQSSLYPFAALSGPSAVGLGIPMDEPRVCRLAYNAETGLYYAAFDLALTEATANLPSRASFRLSLFTFEPAWGFRAAAARYYALYPQCFTKRVKRDGGWVCWGNGADVPDLASLACAYHWGLVGPDAVKWANDHGLLALPYVEATNLHQTMEEFTSATSDEVVKRLAWIANPQRTEPLPAWKYDHPYNSFLGDRDAALRQSAAAYLASLLYDRQGKIYGSASKTEFGLLIAKYIPCDANPYLPGGIGQYFLDTWLPKCQAYLESKGGHVDGLAMDNFHVGDAALGRRREQFAAETIPLCFDTATGEPVLIKPFTTFEFTREAGKRLWPQGKVIIANTCNARYPFAYSLLDIHGWEWGIEANAAYARTVAYHKPVCSLPVQPAHRAEAWVKWHLRYGFMPGGYANSQELVNHEALARYAPLARDLQVAGWEPITAARSDVPAVTLERFGTSGAAGLYLTVYNADRAPHEATITLDLARLGLPAAPKVMDVLAKQPVPCSGGRLKVTVAEKDVVVLKLTPNQPRA